MTKVRFFYIIIVIAVVLFASNVNRLDANSVGVPEVVFHDVISEFPNGIRFKC